MSNNDPVRTKPDHDVDESIEVIRSRILSDISEGIMLIGFNGFIMYANATASKILGIPEEEMTGHSFASLFFDKSMPWINPRMMNSHRRSSTAFMTGRGRMTIF